MELVCPAGSPAALDAALEHGADAVYVGLRNPTNARAFPGLNFTPEALVAAVSAAHARRKKLYLALNTYPTSRHIQVWKDSIDTAAAAGVDAFIIADMALLDYAARRHAGIPRHLSVQGSATTAVALRFFYEHFGIARAVLPRVLSIAQVERLCEHSPVAIEVFAFGSLCIMVEGRCQLSSHVTGQSPNCHGVCSPAEHVHWTELPGNRREVRLGQVLVDRFEPEEPASYPTLCKGRYQQDGNPFYALEEPTSLNTLELLPRLAQAGVAALKVEGRQRGPAYVTQVTRVWRGALDALKGPQPFRILPEWEAQLSHVSEGLQTTLGPYHRRWQ
ncbi:MAG: U32 family peptidase [Betaproteobacteria bacterium]|nr:U32 family peptidase [Betaproteobacteria bacterium]